MSALRRLTRQDDGAVASSRGQLESRGPAGGSCRVDGVGSWQDFEEGSGVAAARAWTQAVAAGSEFAVAPKIQRGLLSVYGNSEFRVPGRESTSEAGTVSFGAY